MAIYMRNSKNEGGSPLGSLMGLVLGVMGRKYVERGQTKEVAKMLEKMKISGDKEAYKAGGEAAIASLGQGLGVQPSSGGQSEEERAIAEEAEAERERQKVEEEARRNLLKAVAQVPLVPVPPTGR